MSPLNLLVQDWDLLLLSLFISFLLLSIVEVLFRDRIDYEIKGKSENIFLLSSKIKLLSKDIVLLDGFTYNAFITLITFKVQAHSE